MTPTNQHYGFWPSPLSPEIAATLKISISTLRSLHEDYFWIEGRPDLGGRRVVISWDQTEAPVVISPEGVSFVSRVHEYGGGAMEVTDIGGPLVIGVQEDQSVISFRPGDDQISTLIAAEPNRSRGGLLRVDKTPWILFVEEDTSTSPVRRSISALDGSSGTVVELVVGRDFYGDIDVNPNATELAFSCWDHPLMPWESGEIWTAPITWDETSLSTGMLSHVSGGVGSPASQPTYGPDGSLLFYEEAHNWTRPFRRSVEGSIEEISDQPFECGGPMWVLGQRQLSEVQGSIYGVETQDGLTRPVKFEKKKTRTLDTLSTAVGELAVTASSMAWITKTPTSLASIGLVRPAEQHDSILNAVGPVIPLDAGDFSYPQGVTGNSRNGGEVYGVFYGPANNDVSVNPPSLPPVIMFCHGGPTSSAQAGFDPIVHFFTTRGFAVVAVNYAGSSGYGKSYRHRLEGNWGIDDVEDCIDLLASLGEQGLVDTANAAIRGGSAGGFTALMALTSGAFRCATSLYGVADLLALAANTHDFESRYLDSLVGTLPEHHDRYVERSPVTRASEMKGAVLLLQGLDDPVVPPEQARSMATALRKNGNEVTLIEFEGETHGFRRLDTLMRSLEAELALYQRQLCQGLEGESE